MSNNQATWSFNDGEIPSIDPHTRVKHLILEQYVENLIFVMHGKTQYGIKSFTFIDGFCGGGQYRDENGELWYGSPIRIIQAVRRGFEKAKRKYSKPIDIKYIFIDSQQQHLEFLKKTAFPQANLELLVDQKQHSYIHEQYGELREECEFINGKFESHIDYVLLGLDLRKGHSLFFLDPFGYTDVSMLTFRKINHLPKSEIIYTYMIDYIRRFLSQRDGQLSKSFNQILEANDYYRSAKLEDNSFGQQCYLRDQTLLLFRSKGFNHRSESKPLLFTFSLIPKGNKIVLYYLLHMSRNLKALEVIKQCFQENSNLDYQYHYEIYGYGHRTSDFYNQNMNQIQLNITTSDDIRISTNGKLDEQVGELIYKHSDGLSFSNIKNQTMELNPATLGVYMEYIQKCQQEQEFEVLRKGKLFKGFNLQNGDIIRKTKSKQLFLFGC